MDYRDTDFESTRDLLLPTLGLEIALPNNSNGTQKYGERYLLRKNVFDKTLFFCLEDAQYQNTSSDPH